MNALAVLHIGRDEDVVAARRLARRASELLGYEDTEQVRLATAISELGREALRRGGGQLRLGLEPSSSPSSLVVRLDTRAGADGELPLVVTSPSVAIARRLLGDAVVSKLPEGGFSVRLRRSLPRPWRERDDGRIHQVAAALEGERQEVDPFVELQRQNGELASALEQLRERQEELEHLNGELENTNRGVVALYAELDERAAELKRADEMKSRFLSHMSHEFRSPLSSILAISRLLAEETDGPLNAEQQKQVGFVMRAAEQLYALIEDLLDLSRVEAGKTQLHLEPLRLGPLFGTLRGLTRPLVPEHGRVQLVIEEPPDLVITNDEGKVAQILRNFLSNALKFTERGEVRLQALQRDASTVAITVRDTGIGIAPGDHERVFSEFGQLETNLHRRVKGTGLGLALSRRLAELLGGSIELVSTPGEGSAFTLVLPHVHPHAVVEASDGGGDNPLLVVEDDDAFRYIILELLRRLNLPAIALRDGSEALAALGTNPPPAMLLDLMMPNVDGFTVLAQLRERPEHQDLPVVVVTSKTLLASEREALEHGRAVVLAKHTLADAGATTALREALRAAGWRERAGGVG